MQRFKNKTILITGASSGIGLAGAEQLVKEGAKLVITGRTHSRLEKALDYLGKNTIGILDDVSDGKTIDRLLPIVKEIGAGSRRLEIAILPKPWSTSKGC